MILKENFNLRVKISGAGGGGCLIALIPNDTNVIIDFEKAKGIIPEQCRLSIVDVESLGLDVRVME